MKRGFGLVLSTVMSASAFAQVVGTENFSAALGSNWVSPVSYTDTGTVSRSLAVGSGRLNWTASITGAVGGGSSNALLTWDSDLAYASDWAVTLDVTNSFSAVSSSNVQIGLRLWNASDSTDAVKLVLDQSNFGSVTNRFHSLFTGPGTTALGDSTNGVAVGTTGMLGVSFNSATKVITTLYDSGGGWVQIGSFGIDTGGGSNANADWDMTNGSSNFRVGIFATAGIFADNVGLELESGTAFADDFSLANGTLTAVPEPASWAVVLGSVSVIGAAVWRGRRQPGAAPARVMP